MPPAFLGQVLAVVYNNLELFSNAMIYAKRMLPDPIVVPTKGEALGARFHARVALIYAIETAMIEDSATPEDLAITFLETS